MHQVLSIKYEQVSEARIVHGFYYKWEETRKNWKEEKN